MVRHHHDHHHHHQQQQILQQQHQMMVQQSLQQPKPTNGHRLTSQLFGLNDWDSTYPLLFRETALDGEYFKNMVSELSSFRKVCEQKVYEVQKARLIRHLVCMVFMVLFALPTLGISMFIGAIAIYFITVSLITKQQAFMQEYLQSINSWIDKQNQKWNDANIQFTRVDLYGVQAIDIVYYPNLEKRVETNQNTVQASTSLGVQDDVKNSIQINTYY